MNLTSQQRAAVESQQPAIVCVAAAGSGKTAVLTERIAHLITKCGCSPEDIMAFTFTRKAAREMRERLALLLRPFFGERTEYECRRLLIDTFHAIGLRMLNEYGGAIGYKPGITVLCEEDAKRVFDGVINDLGIRKAPHTRKMLRAYYSTGFLRQESLDDRIGRRVITEYHSRLRSMNATDYGYILIALMDCLPRDQVFAKHFLVDEAQDCDQLQWDFAYVVARGGDTSFVVGDPSQSIYEWRGASPKGLIELAEDGDRHPLAKTFRCGWLICEAANRVIEGVGCATRPVYHMPVECGTGQDGAVIQWSDKDCPGERFGGIAGCVTSIQNMRQIDWSDIAVLCRTNRVADWVSDLLARAGVPHQRAGRVARIAETPEFRRLWAAMSLVVNPRNDAAFHVLQEDLKIPSQRMHRVTAAVHGSGLSRWEALEVAGCAGGRPNVLEYLIRTSKPTTSFGHFVKRLNVPFSKTNDGRVRANLIADLLNACTETNDTIAMALGKLELLGADDMDDPAVDEVYVGTIHGAKGLEWRGVILAGLEEGYFPSRLGAMAGTHELDPERRLAYVGATRARDVLVVHYHETPSLFARELLGKET